MNENEVKANIKKFLVENLGIDEGVLNYDSPLFGDGDIGLDSIDSLEIISYIDGEYGISMTGVGREHFQTIDSLAAYVVANAQ